MIIVDTNTIIYLYLPSEFSAQVEEVFRQDSHWIAPLLWRSELRNVLAVYMRRNLIELTDALDIQRRAEHLLSGNEYEVDSLGVLKLANESGCSAYDCEFIYLAEHTNCKLVTADKKVLRNFPTVAIKAQDFILASTPH
jgi:predicted nucleic acid-binding protein